jgi:SAM-dependent methyltransferase
MKRFVSSWTLSLAVALVLVVVPAMAQQTQAPLRSPDVIFVPTPPEVVKAMLETAKVGKGDIVYDLGSGDGRIVIAAAERYGARGVGIEIDPVLVLEARLNAAAAGQAERVTFVEGDFFTADLAEATVVTLYLSPSVNLRLRSRLQRELKPGTRIVSHQFAIEGWPPEREVMVGGRPIFFWTVPASGR